MVTKVVTSANSTSRTQNIAHQMVAASESRVRSAPKAIAFFGTPAIIRKTGNDRSPSCVWHSSKFLNVRFVLKTTPFKTARGVLAETFSVALEIRHARDLRRYVCNGTIVVAAPSPRSARCSIVSGGLC